MNDEENITIGEMIDNIIENPQILISQFGKMLDDCNKVNENLKLELKNKQSEIDYLKGKISVYEKFLNKDEEKIIEENYNHIPRID